MPAAEINPELCIKLLCANYAVEHAMKKLGKVHGVSSLL
jgi:hypothetical protein